LPFATARGSSIPGPWAYFFYGNHGGAAPCAGTQPLGDDVLIVIGVSIYLHHALAVLSGVNAFLYPPTKGAVLEDHRGGDAACYLHNARQPVLKVVGIGKVPGNNKGRGKSKARKLVILPVGISLYGVRLGEAVANYVMGKILGPHCVGIGVQRSGPRTVSTRLLKRN